jgi:hypothetical protein
MVFGVDLSAPDDVAAPHSDRLSVGAPRSWYRIHMLDHQHRILKGSEADRADDAGALAWAAATLGNHLRAEIWQGARCVGQVPNIADSVDRGLTGAPPATDAAVDLAGLRMGEFFAAPPTKCLFRQQSEHPTHAISATGNMASGWTAAIAARGMEGAIASAGCWTNAFPPCCLLARNPSAPSPSHRSKRCR